MASHRFKRMVRAEIVIRMKLGASAKEAKKGTCEAFGLPNIFVSRIYDKSVKPMLAGLHKRGQYQLRNLF